jgi:molybdate transport repressor ModE-like protein
MGMAYSKAWQSVRQAEAATGFPLLLRRTGGSDGGGSTLSPQGIWLVGAFSALLADAEAVIAQLGEKHLRDWPGPDRGESRELRTRAASTALQAGGSGDLEAR